VRRLTVSLAVLALGTVLVPFAPGVGADEPTTVASAEVQSYAIRVEYDIPLPVSPGTIPHVVGDVRRSGAGENAKGLAAAPTGFDAVVGGTYYDPDKDNDQPLVPCGPGARTGCNLPPQTECFYPGDLLDTDFRFPTETKADTAALPATSYSTARCGAGPEVELHAVGAGDGPGYTVAASAADALARPVKGVLESTTAVRASGISIGAGAITVANIEAAGHSEVTGKKGGQNTEASVALTDINAAGTKFSIANNRLIIGGQAVPVDSSAAQSFMDQINAGLASTNCTLSLMTDPARYPQGFLLSRKEPRIGMAEDGTFAGSMKAGLLVLCDLPEELSAGTDFKPQRLQAVLGFAYTSAAAEGEPGGFGLGDLGNTVLGQSILAPSAATPSLPDLSPAVAPIDGAPAPAAAPTQRLQSRPAATRLPAPLGSFDMDPATRWLLGLGCVVVWAALTHAGVRRLQRVLAT
jgi:hypothetical protein